MFDPRILQRVGQLAHVVIAKCDTELGVFFVQHFMDHEPHIAHKRGLLDNRIICNIAQFDVAVTVHTSSGNFFPTDGDFDFEG